MEKTQGSIGIVFVNVLKIAEGIQFGVVTNEDFNFLQDASAAKWPGLYRFKGLRSE